MDQPLYAKFSHAIQSLPAGDLPHALDGAERAVNEANRDHESAVLLLAHSDTGLPVDRLLRVFTGHTVGEAVAVMTRLRGELADELAKRGAPADVVRELREGGPKGESDDVQDERVTPSTSTNGTWATSPAGGGTASGAGNSGLPGDHSS